MDKDFISTLRGVSKSVRLSFGKSVNPKEMRILSKFVAARFEILNVNAHLRNLSLKLGESLSKRLLSCP